jgi:hypothetical protein
VAAGSVNARPTKYVRYTILQKTSAGFPVNGSASLRANYSASLILPAEWRRLGAPAGRLRFVAGATGDCHYRIAFSTRVALGARGDPTSHVEASLSAPDARYRLDQGVRGSAAWRVVRTAGRLASVQLRAQRAQAASGGSGLPAGQTAWFEIDVTATSTQNSDCHEGTWRDVLGPALGDGLAAARTRVRLFPST